MPLYLKVARTLTIILGWFFIASVLLVLVASALNVQVDVRVGFRVVFVALFVGVFLVIPHRRIVASRLGPVWVALSFLLTAVATYGFGFNAWRMFASNTFNPTIVVMLGMWLCFCANAEYARRIFISSYARNELA